MAGNRTEMCFAGSGGQGVILASIIFAEAAVIAGKKTVQSQSYGPEARGGSCCAEAIVSESEIYFSKMTRPDFLLALTQPALDKYIARVREGGLAVIDDTLTEPKAAAGVRFVRMPILKTAKEEVGNPMTANIVAVGAINAVLKLFDEGVLFEAVKRHIPAGTEKVNLAAFEAGKRLGEKAA